MHFGKRMLCSCPGKRLNPEILCCIRITLFSCCCCCRFFFFFFFFFCILRPVCSQQNKKHLQLQSCANKFLQGRQIPMLLLFLQIIFSGLIRIWWNIRKIHYRKSNKIHLKCIWTASSEFGTYRLCEQRRFRRACASAQSRQNLRCSLIQTVSQEEPSDRKPDPWPLWMAGHAQLKLVVTKCSKTQIRLTGLIWCEWYFDVFGFMWGRCFHVKLFT